MVAPYRLRYDARITSETTNSGDGYAMART